MNCIIEPFPTAKYAPPAPQKACISNSLPEVNQLKEAPKEAGTAREEYQKLLHGRLAGGGVGFGGGTEPPVVKLMFEVLPPMENWPAPALVIIFPKIFRLLNVISETIWLGSLPEIVDGALLPPKT